MRRESKSVPLSASAIAAAIVTAVTLAAGAVASSIETAVTIKTHGEGRRGDPVSISMRTVNRADAPKVVPGRINSLELRSSSLKINPRAQGIGTCAARIRSNGLEPLCPQRSLVGTGSVYGVIGKPGGASDEFGQLSEFAGRVIFYNYRRGRSSKSQLLVVIKTSKPFRGVSVPVRADLNRSGRIRLRVPNLKELPKSLSDAYPSDNSLVVTELNAQVGRSGGRPSGYLSRTTPSALAYEVNIR